MLKVHFYWEDPINPDLIHQSWESAFQRPVPKEQWNKIWKWRFETNPYAAQVFAAYVWEDDTVACFYAVTPLQLVQPGGSDMLAGHMIAGFTNPKFQGKGYYLEMNNQMHERLKTMGFKCLYGLANGNSHYSYRKYLEWKDVALLTNFKLSRNNQKMGLEVDSAYRCNREDLSLDLLHRISSCYVAGDKYHIKRSFASLKWRLLEHPVNDYYCITTFKGNSVLAYTIIKPYLSEEADIMEIFYTSEDLLGLPSILTAIAGFLLNNGYGFINVWSNLFSDEHLTFERIGFTESMASTYFGVINFADLSDIDSIHKWHYRFLDSDVY